MFGTHLRLERARLGYSSKDVSARLSLTDTYLRLVESGRATLNQSLAFRLIEVFADAGPTQDTRAISFPRLALFAVGIHWVGAEMAAHPGRDAGKRATEALASRDTDFDIFFRRTKPYFELGEDSDAQKAFLEEVAAQEVGLFLRSDSYGREDIKDILNNILDLRRDLLDLPTLNIDLLLDLKQALAGRSFVHTDGVAARWETQRASQFRLVRGLFLHAKPVVTQENLDCFHYEYLSQERFLGLQFIFMNADISSVQLKRLFITLLNKGREKVKLEPLTRKECDKIHILRLSDSQREEHDDVLTELRRRDERTGNPYDAYWSFETHYNLHIGFIGWLGDANPDSTRNLTLNSSVAKAIQFSTLWDNLNAANNS